MSPSGGGTSDGQALDCNEIQKLCQCGGIIPSTVSPKGKVKRPTGRPGGNTASYANSYFG